MEETGWLQEILDDVKAEIVHWPPWMRYIENEDKSKLNVSRRMTSYTEF